ncbi:hypothetical protein J6590_056240 [Homalodisca vitripennis]|nr:hypothetical protein J6590_056240 [Homalodisca vitripennis]
MVGSPLPAAPHHTSLSSVLIAIRTNVTSYIRTGPDNLGPWSHSGLLARFVWPPNGYIVPVNVPQRITTKGGATQGNKDCKQIIISGKGEFASLISQFGIVASHFYFGPYSLVLPLLSAAESVTDNITTLDLRSAMTSSGMT